MTSEDRLGSRAALEGKRQALFIVRCSTVDRQAQSEQTVEEPPLGGFEASPRNLRFRRVSVRDINVQLARQTQRALAFDRDRPITDIVLNVVATKTVTAVLRLLRERHEFGRLCRRPVFGLKRVERADHVQFRDIGESMPALLTTGVLEEEGLAAAGTGEELHTRPGLDAFTAPPGRACDRYGCRGGAGAGTIPAGSGQFPSYGGQLGTASSGGG